MNKVLLAWLWLATTATTLVVALSLVFLGTYHTKGSVKGTSTTSAPPTTSYRLFNALPANQNTIEQSATLEDARVEIIRQFLAKYNSPLEPHAQVLVETADKYNLDFRLIPAIAMQESNLCRVIPEDSHNCWGYGIYGDQVMRFPDYPTAIETVAKGVSQNYIYDGLTTPDQIMRRYTPGSKGSWSNGVQTFMDQME